MRYFQQGQHSCTTSRATKQKGGAAFLRCLYRQKGRVPHSSGHGVRNHHNILQLDATIQETTFEHALTAHACQKNLSRKSALVNSHPARLNSNSFDKTSQWPNPRVLASGGTQRDALFRRSPASVLQRGSGQWHAGNGSETCNPVVDWLAMEFHLPVFARGPGHPDQERGSQTAVRSYMDGAGSKTASLSAQFRQCDLDT